MGQLIGQLIGILIAFLVALCVNNDANKRGMNGLGWAIFVFLIMIIGLPSYFIFRKPKIENK